MSLIDAHCHIIDPRFPLVENQGYLPPAFTVADYRARTAGLEIAGGVVVSGSFQAFDQGYLTDALAALGAGFVGVTNLPPDATDETVLALDRAGVRAARFNLKRGGTQGVGALDRVARRVHELAGWHVELYADARELTAMVPALVTLPKLSIDHLGMSAEGLPTLLKLVDAGVRVKATGFGRVDLDPATALRAVAAANPEALMFGTDLPSTRARRPFDEADIDLLRETLGEDLARRALHDNAQAFYRLPRS